VDQSVCRFETKPQETVVMQLDTIILFVAASIVLAFALGPDNIFVATQSAINGWRQGIAVTLGLCAGLTVYTLAVAFGMAVIFQTSHAASSH
jgi:threonine/homoserine/homoserine lactone efflux protein